MMNHGTLDDVAPVEMRIPAGGVTLEGELAIPSRASGCGAFRARQRQQQTQPAQSICGGLIRESGNGTLLFDLLTREEEREDIVTAGLRFDIGLLARRLVDVTHWLLTMPAARNLGIGYFGSSTGAAAALMAAAEGGRRIDTVVSRGGRPDLAGEALAAVKAPTLLIVAATITR